MAFYNTCNMCFSSDYIGIETRTPYSIDDSTLNKIKDVTTKILKDKLNDKKENLLIVHNKVAL